MMATRSAGDDDGGVGHPKLKLHSEIDVEDNLQVLQVESFSGQYRPGCDLPDSQTNPRPFTS